MYEIEFAEEVAEDLAGLRAYDRAYVLDHIEKQLRHQPTQKTQHKKMLVGLVPPWGYVEPVWQLSIGAYRVFYDVDEARAVVVIRAIRFKPPHQTTEEIL